MTMIKILLWAVMSGTVVASTVGCTATDTSRGTGEVIDDAGLTARAKLALVNEPDVAASAIEVETYRGVIQLSGFVDSTDMARRAVSAVSKVPGHRGVKNDMRVKPAKG